MGMLDGKVFAQLYSLISTNNVTENVLPALEVLSKIGYDGVELMGANTCGMSVEGFRKHLESLHLIPISSHNLTTEEHFEFAQGMGIHYGDIRAEMPDSKMDTILKVCEKMNEDGRIRQKYGIHAVYHNHSQEFRKIEGQNDLYVYDVMIQNTDPSLVGFEFDVGWGAFSGVKPIDFIRKYPGRFPLIHVKEVLRSAVSDAELEHFPADVLKMGPPIKPRNPKAAKEGHLKYITYFTEEQARILYNRRRWNGRLGTGIIDWKELAETCIAQGTVGFINEREHYGYSPEDNEIICAKDDYEYLRSL